jgi:hypothetical protein
MIPAEFSVTEFARLVGRPRRVIAYRCRVRQLPVVKRGEGRTAKLYIPTALLRERCPELWDVLTQNYDLAREMEDDAV